MKQANNTTIAYMLEKEAKALQFSLAAGTTEQIDANLTQCMQLLNTLVRRTGYLDRVIAQTAAEIDVPYFLQEQAS